MGEWKEYKLGNIAECSLGKMLDRKKNHGSPRPYLNNVSLRWGSFDIDYSQTMLFEDSELERFQIKKNDIVMCEGGEPGRCAVWTSDEPICYQKALHRIRAKEGFDNWFVYYYLCHYVHSGRIQAFFTGTTIKHLPLQNLKSLVISVPDFQTQQEISSILSSLDDKIAVNRRICQNLEEQAQALFKHWFVDFAPFKDGKFVESELGMIPEGWRVGTLADIAEFKRGKTITKSETKEGNVPVVAGGLEPAYYHSESNTSERVITISASGANAGFTRMYYSPVWASDCSFVDNSASAYIHTAYCFLLTKKKAVNSLQWGAAQPHVYAKDINKLSLVIPPSNILAQFEEMAKQMFDMVDVSVNESSRLSVLRDTLLPKLMSGQIRL